MGLQEYVVTKKKHSINDFIEFLGRENISCITIPKKNIIGTDYDVTVDIKKDEEYVVLYGDRHDLRDLLEEHFPEESFWGSEFVNFVATGKNAPSRDEMNEVFKDILIEDYLKKK